MDGREALAIIKADAGLRDSPVVVMTTSSAAIDVDHAYSVGANSFVTKPLTFTELIARIQELGRYWLEIVELPRADAA
jgi:CheY-like chemotaxis protein